MHKKACFSFIGWIHFGTKGYIRHQKWLYQFTDYKRNGKFIWYDKPSQKLLATQVFSTFFVANKYFWIVFKTNESDRTVYSNLNSFFSAVLSHIKRAAAEAWQFLEICCLWLTRDKTDLIFVSFLELILALFFSKEKLTFMCRMRSIYFFGFKNHFDQIILSSIISSYK